MSNTDTDAAAFSIADFARQYGIGRTLAYAEINAGRLHTCKVGRRTIIARKDADAWLDMHPHAGASRLGAHMLNEAGRRLAGVS